MPWTFGSPSRNRISAISKSELTLLPGISLRPVRTVDHPQISPVACPYHPLAKTVSWASGRVRCLSQRWAQMHGQTISGKMLTQYPIQFLDLPETPIVKAPVYVVIAFALAAGLGVNAMAGLAFAQTTEQPTRSDPTWKYLLVLDVYG